MTKRIGAALAALALALAGVIGQAGPAMAGPFNGAGFYYAGGSQTLTGTDTAGGLAANFLIVKPYVQNVLYNGTRDHSLAELAVHAGTNGTAGKTIEVGVASEPTVWGDTNPHLFVCAWDGGVTVSTCYTGGSTWVDYGGNCADIGVDLSHRPLCTTPQTYADDTGTAKTISVQYASTGCGARPAGWWVAYGGSWIGCYTDQTWGSSFTSSQFIQAFGEVAYNGSNNSGTSNDKPCTDMGKGGTPGSGQAYIASLSMINQSPSTLVTSFTLFSDTDTNAYSAAWTSGTTTRSFYYGGAGYKFTAGVASTPGNAGSC